MLIKANYLGVMLIWSTTPLAIKWSGEGLNPIFAAMARMSIGLAATLLVILLLGIRVRWSKQAIKAYLAAGLGIYGSMLAVYSAAQYVPSGWISVVFGLTPIVTGILASNFLDESPLVGFRLFGLLLGLAGLAAMFYQGAQISAAAIYGIGGLLLSVFLHSLSAVAVKWVDYQGRGLEMTAGGLLVAVPLYLVTWLIAGAQWPAQLSERTLWSLLYLGTIATVAGFSMYFFILRHLDATRVALLTLITPVVALWLGYSLNAEPVSLSLLAGTFLIVAGLAVFELGDRARKEIPVESPL